MANVRSILEEWLKANGFDGLYSDDCGCEIGDLAPCDEPMTACEPGYLSACDHDSCGEDHDFHISAERAEVKA